MLFAWSLSGFVIPGIGTVLTALYGTQSFIYVAIAIAVAYCLFVHLADCCRPRRYRPRRPARSRR